MRFRVPKAINEALERLVEQRYKDGTAQISLSSRLSPTRHSPMILIQRIRKSRFGDIYHLPAHRISNNLAHCFLVLTDHLQLLPRVTNQNAEYHHLDSSG
ncbi:hypothetical protein F2Q70_00029199 [Brassica cretica]|uniref:Uncharacterized protein n=2 Tax=Brassica cretica TaxID=69181 RepID=A0A3N6Q336_BRACR|nr:hypothetical protein F2Q70_00029199 [Brassica cretica]KAF2550167.1 hypothetical protein F2Q68_00033577 [Brassica cretica]KAF3516612.1 hypothetical protein DY000_02060659 [Brassica cretica]